MEREIWFKCPKCGTEAYCEVSFGRRPDGVRWDGMQYFDPNTGKGVVFAFRGTTPETEHTFQLGGLERKKNYRLWCEDGSSPERMLKGSVLMSKGLAVTLSEPGTSEIVYIEEQ